MNNPDTDWIKPGVQAVVTLLGPWRDHSDDHWKVMAPGHIPGDYSVVYHTALRPLPPPLSPTAQCVVEAAMAWRKDNPVKPGNYPSRAMCELAEATDAHLATLRPADPLAVAMELAMDALNEASLHFAGHGSKIVAESKVNGARPIVSAAILLIERGGKGEG